MIQKGGVGLRYGFVRRGRVGQKSKKVRHVIFERPLDKIIGITKFEEAIDCWSKGRAIKLCSHQFDFSFFPHRLENFLKESHGKSSFYSLHFIAYIYLRCATPRKIPTSSKLTVSPLETPRINVGK